MKKSVKFLILSIVFAIATAMCFVIVGAASCCLMDWLSIAIIVGYTLLGAFFAFLFALAVMDYVTFKKDE
jgi:hypothetical protein